MSNFYTYGFYFNILDFQVCNAKESKCQETAHYLQKNAYRAIWLFLYNDTWPKLHIKVCMKCHLHRIQTNKLRSQYHQSTHWDGITLLMPTQSPAEFQWTSLHDSTCSAVCRIRVWLGYLGVTDELKAYHLAMKSTQTKLTNCDGCICAVFIAGSWIQVGY